MSRNIDEIFRSNDLHYEWYELSDSVIEVDVQYGDWKHDHAYLDYIMKENGWYLTSEVGTDEDGSDCYSSLHRYLYYGN